mmetsp:Transcript_28719/g.65091  ORF Transcript_28719/g.65091 Transcript_28719/m.65091 type:complete len:209 (+) Transcript_28719:56-682(+)
MQPSLSLNPQTIATTLLALSLLTQRPQLVVCSSDHLEFVCGFRSLIMRFGVGMPFLCTCDVSFLQRSLTHITHQAGSDRNLQQSHRVFYFMSGNHGRHLKSVRLLFCLLFSPMPEMRARFIVFAREFPRILLVNFFFSLLKVPPKRLEFLLLLPRTLTGFALFPRSLVDKLVEPFLKTIRVDLAPALLPSRKCAEVHSKQSPREQRTG